MHAVIHSPQQAFSQQSSGAAAIRSRSHSSATNTRPTGMLHLPEVCGEPERKAALLSTTSAHLLRTASSRSQLHSRARMRLRADEHLTVRRALRPKLHGESADVVRNLAETAPSTVSADVASSEDEV